MVMVQCAALNAPYAGLDEVQGAITLHRAGGDAAAALSMVHDGETTGSSRTPSAITRAQRAIPGKSPRGLGSPPPLTQPVRC